MCEDHFHNSLYLYKRKVKIKKRLLFAKPKVNVLQLVLFSKRKNKKEDNNIQGIEEIIFKGKYFFKIYPLTGRDSLLPDKICNRKVDGPICSTI